MYGNRISWSRKIERGTMPISFNSVMSNLGISEEELLDAEYVDIERHGILSF